MKKRKLDLALCSLESFKFASELESIANLPMHLRQKLENIKFHISTIERSLKIIEKTCGVKLKRSWDDLNKAKKYLEEKDESMAILLIDRIKRDFSADIVVHF